MEACEEKLQKLVEGLKSAFGEELTSVILYGSAAANEYHSRHSDLNVLVVVKNSRFHKVGRAAEITRWWNKAGNPPPLFFTEHELQESADVFPIEFSDMKEVHRILFGTDPLADLNLDRRHLRLQCEHELRGKLLRLRSRYVLAKGNVHDATALLTQSISTFAVLFRHALLLLGHSVSQTKGEIFELAAKEFRFDGTSFLEILAVRRDEKKLTETDLEPLFEKFFEAIQQVIEQVDGLAS